VKSHAQVVVIGGGVVGCSVAYHLTKLGLADVVLLERKDLTAGSSWHAAGGFHALNSDPNVSRLQAYTIRLYREIEKASGQDVGLHFTGGLTIAATRDRWDFLRADQARHRVLGLETELLGPAEIRELCPLIDVSSVLGAIYDRNDGHLDPSGATRAYAKAARDMGAEIYRHCRVIDLEPRAAGGWRVRTENGDIDTEHVVNAAGLWAREVGRMAGVDLPVVAMEHHYLLTEDLPEVASLKRELPLVLDLDGEIYLRQERKGVLLGVYEKDATTWAVNGTPWDFEAELLPPNLDRLAESLEKGFRRFPALADAGIRRVVNGPFTFTPDGNPLVGPVRGLRNYWVACGVMAGFAQGGGIGLALAHWLIDGEPDGDIYAMDVARFGPYTSRPYSIAKAREFYAKRFQIAYPNEYWPAGRPAKTSTVHGTLKAANAVFGASYGLEIPLYFASAGEPAVEEPNLRRSNAFQAVQTECLASRSTVGVLDISSFAKYFVRGPDATRALNWLLAARLPDTGRIRLTPMLTASGRLMGDLTTARLNDDEFLIGGSGYLQTWHGRWFDEKLAAFDVECVNGSDQYDGVAIFGPRAREVLTRLTETDVSHDAFPFMSVRRMPIGLAQAIVSRMSITGELGFEIYVPTRYMTSVFDLVREAVEGLKGRLVGMYALNALRIEKSVGIWSREFSRDYTPRMSGLDRFVAHDKADFCGKAAALRDRDTTPKRRLVTLVIDSEDADAQGYEPIYNNSEYVGYVTSGGYGHCARASIAMGYVDSAITPEGSGLAVAVLGQRVPARVLSEALVDPSGSRMRT
jgi:dimethylglycine dehydrogenase